MKIIADPAAAQAAARAGAPLGAALKQNDQEAFVKNRQQRQLDRVGAKLGDAGFLQREGRLLEQQDELRKARKVAVGREKFGAFGGASASIGNAVGELTEFGAAIGNIAAPAAIAIGALVAIGAGLFALAKAADPEAAKEWDKAWADLFAVLGAPFVGILKDATSGLRDFADVVKTINKVIPKGAVSEIAKGSFNTATGGWFKHLGIAVDAIRNAGALEDSTGAAGGLGAASFGSTASVIQANNLAAFASSDKSDEPAKNSTLEKMVELFTQVKDYFITGRPVERATSEGAGS